ncbi:MAG TPA: hypothetical protein VFB50_17695 [Chloroflexota bacterium]|nr:hypothetical protein [Chloroflexota bacterium]
MRVLSLGAGVQSSTLLLMAREGELDLDAAVFADTRWEPAAVYAHLDWLESVSTIPVERVSHGDIRALTLEATRFASLPFYIEQPDGSQGMGRRQCSKEYKIYPIRRWLRAHGAKRSTPAQLVFGISLDEHQRMRDSDVSYVVHEYPLVQRRMTRGDCLLWLEQHGYPRPPKSACIGCPYRRDSEWRNLTPVEFADAVDFDRAIRVQRGMHGQQFVHRSFVPLDQVDLRSQQDRGQLEMFDEECEGVCGV